MNIPKRIEALEQTFIKEPIIVLCEDADGIQYTMTMREMLDKGYGLIKCLSGADPDELWDYLKSIQEYAEKGDNNE